MQGAIVASLVVASRKSQIDFRVHVVRAGNDDGARTDFHRMLSALVGVNYPTATDMRADPGDWGIDVYVGSLIDRVSIWQSKYFYQQIGDSQKRQIRESFSSAMMNAKENGYHVEAWTLCVACELSPKERRWWDTKVRAWLKEYPSLSIDLWDAPRLRRFLLAPEAADVVNEFYPENASSPMNTSVSPLPISANDPPTYEGALFVKQLQIAGVQELDAQRKAFFNADLLVRDVESRSVPDQVAAVHEIDVSLQAQWEDAVADPATEPTADKYEESAKRLYAATMRKSQELMAPHELPVRPLHLRGLMHRIVDDARAGWVHDWRGVAANHADSEEAQPESIADDNEENNLDDPDVASDVSELV